MPNQGVVHKAEKKTLLEEKVILKKNSNWW